MSSLIHDNSISDIVVLEALSRSLDDLRRVQKLLPLSNQIMMSSFFRNSKFFCVLEDSLGFVDAVVLDAEVVMVMLMNDEAASGMMKRKKFSSKIEEKIQIQPSSY
ncbi:unnamed protein product [Vicia faba]|uniref:Uncharacterized protein n=1 Tax=Vicia faba TaxID=3906 RepID=A0AAV1A033_VICFA|nr:unnamed protein product [Vicia faba]